MKFSFKQLLVVLLSAIVITTTLQTYIGKPFLYSVRQGYWKESTLNLHKAILSNHPPAGTTWVSLGANGTNTRFAVVFLAECLHRLTHKSLFSIYYWFDNAALTLNFVLLFLFLSLFVTADWALSGTIFFYFLQITTYLNHYFHPWDRISLSFWLIMLAFIYKNKPRTFGLTFLATFFLGLCVKYDLIIVSVVTSVFYYFRKNNPRQLVAGPLLFCLGFGFLSFLGHWRSGGVPLSPFDLSLYSTLLKGNFDYIKNFGLAYPPFLVFFLPMVCAVLGWKAADLFPRVCFCIGAIGLFGYFFTSWFHETRAEMPFLLLIFPASLQGMKHLFSSMEGLTQSEQHP